MRVGLAAELGRGAGEELGFRRHLGVDLEADHDLPVARRALDELGADRCCRHVDDLVIFAKGLRRGRACHAHHGSGGAMRPAACSSVAPRANRVSSSNGRPISCRPSGRPVGGKPRRRDEARQARHVDRHREDVVEVHLDRIGRHLLADPEGGRRRRRRQDRIDAIGEGGLEVALDQGADLLRAHVIGVVIAGRQHVGADHQAPPHLGAEAAARASSRRGRRCRTPGSRRP